MMVAVQLRNLLARLSPEGRASRRARPTLVWARVEPPAGTPFAPLEGALLLTPYTAEVVAADARRAGSGARVDVTVPATLEESGLAWVRAQLGWLVDRDVEVNVHRPVDECPRFELPPPEAGGVVLHIRSKGVAARLVNPGPERP